VASPAFRGRLRGLGVASDHVVCLGSSPRLARLAGARHGRDDRGIARRCPTRLGDRIGERPVNGRNHHRVAVPSRLGSSTLALAAGNNELAEKLDRAPQTHMGSVAVAIKRRGGKAERDGLPYGRAPEEALRTNNQLEVTNETPREEEYGTTGYWADAERRLCHDPMQDLQSWTYSYQLWGDGGDILHVGSGLDDGQARQSSEHELRPPRDAVGHNPSATGSVNSTGSAERHFVGSPLSQEDATLHDAFHETREITGFAAEDELEEKQKWSSDKAAKAIDDVGRAWQKTSSAEDFMSAISADGYRLALGKRRDFLVVDAEGNYYNLARLVRDPRPDDDGKMRSSIKAADVRARLDVIKDQLSDLDFDAAAAVVTAIASAAPNSGGVEARGRRASRRLRIRVPSITSK